MTRLLTLLLLASAALADIQPMPARELIVLHTIAGDLVLALYPDAAPRHVEQLLRLTRMGIYDTTHFYRVEPGFLVQLSAAEDRIVPLSPEQRSLIVPLKAELHPGLEHTRGALTMARRDDDLDSAQTSFSILLGDAPHLDGKYTVFGRLESGFDVLEELVRVPRSASNQPLVRLQVDRAEVMDAFTLSGQRLAPARRIPIPEIVLPEPSSGPVPGGAAPALAAMLAAMVLLDLAVWLFFGRLPERALRAMLLLDVLIGAFALLVVLVPAGHSSPMLATATFAGLLGVIKLMGRLE